MSRDKDQQSNEVARPESASGCTDVQAKTCRSCNLKLPASDFCIKRGKPDTICKACKRVERRHRYREAATSQHKPVAATAPRTEHPQQLTPSEFKELVDIFTTLRQWRDDKNRIQRSSGRVSKPSSEAVFVDPGAQQG